MTLHLQEGLDLTDGQVLPVPQSDKLIEGAKQLVCVLHNFPFVQALASAGDDLCEEV